MQCTIITSPIQFLKHFAAAFFKLHKLNLIFYRWSRRNGWNRLFRYQFRRIIAMTAAVHKQQQHMEMECYVEQLSWYSKQIANIGSVFWESHAVGRFQKNDFAGKKTEKKPTKHTYLYTILFSRGPKLVAAIEIRIWIDKKSRGQTSLDHTILSSPAYLFNNCLFFGLGCWPLRILRICLL